jgi:PmbA protein
LKWVPQILEEVYELWQIQTRLHRKTERFSLSHDKTVEAVHFSVFHPTSESSYWLREDRAYSRPLTESAYWLANLLGRCVDQRSTLPGKDHARSETCPVVVAPWAGAYLLKRMAPWFFADTIQMGHSPLTGARKRALFSEVITLIDDGTISGGVQTHPFDMEGSPTQATSLVERGVVKDFLYDFYTATRENRLSTGNLMRFPQEMLPTVGATNLFIQPGTDSPGDLISSVERGYLIETIEQIEPMAHSETEFKVRANGWKISRGQRSEPVTAISLHIDLVELFRRAVSVGKDLNFYGRFGAPSILFENIPLGI